MATATPIVDVRPIVVPIMKSGETDQLWPLVRQPRHGGASDPAGLPPHLADWSLVLASHRPLSSAEPESLECDEAWENLPQDEVEDDALGDNLLARGLSAALDDEDLEAQPTWLLEAAEREGVSEVRASGAAAASTQPHDEVEVNVEPVAGLEEPRGNEVAAAPNEPAPPVAAAIVPGLRQPAEASVTLPGGGKLVYHHTRQAVEAHCPNPSHGKCVLTRTVVGRQHRGSETTVAGRPLGFLYSWLKASDATKEEHWSKTMWRTVFTEEHRRNSRAELRRLPGALSLFEWERVLPFPQISKTLFETRDLLSDFGRPTSGPFFPKKRTLFFEK